MKELYKRSLTGLIYVLIIVIFLISGAFTYYILFSGFLIIGSLEYYKAFDSKKKVLWKIAAILTGFLFFTATFLDASGFFNISFPVILSCLFLIVFITRLFFEQKELIKQSGNLFMIIIYITLPLSLGNYLVFKQTGNISYNYQLMLNLFVLIWCNDTGAYISGSLIGKHPFFKRLSPKKTWEGVAGGIIFTITAAYLISVFNPQYTLLFWIITGSIVSIFGTLGDLVESMLKRNANIKDMGSIFPGHGGVLDRIDSLLVSIIAVYLFVEILKYL